MITFAQGIAMLGFIGAPLQTVAEAQGSIGPVFRLLDEARLYVEHHSRNPHFVFNRQKKNIMKNRTNGEMIRKMLALPM